MGSTANSYGSTGPLNQFAERTSARSPFRWSTLCAALALIVTGCSGGGPGQITSSVEDDDPWGEFWLESGSTGDGVSRDDVLAMVEMAAPVQQRFNLRTTLPIPKGLFRETDTELPLTIVHTNGLIAKTQMSVVSSYPRASDGADVVELVARVSRFMSFDTGETIRFYVCYYPHERAEFEPTSQIATFFSTPGSCTLRTKDVFGNVYSADLIGDLNDENENVETLREGRAALQHSKHEVMLPTTPMTGAQATLPHMMGVHSYVTRWDEEKYFSLDLHIHNGMSGHDTTTNHEDALDKLYFQSLEVRIPVGWNILGAFEDPFFGAPYNDGGWKIYPIVKPMSGGKMHVMPRQGQFTRRLIVAKDGHTVRAKTVLEEKNLAFCRPGIAPVGAPFFSWWNRSTARYFPQNHSLPDMSHVGLGNVAQELQGDFANYRNHIQNGSSPGYPLMSQSLGWAHPWGVPYGGMTGGVEIHLFDGIDTASTASNPGYRLSQIKMRQRIDRQPTALYDLDGSPSSVETWLREGGPEGVYMPVFIFLNPQLFAGDVFGFLDAPTAQNDAVANLGKRPGYENTLLDYKPVDFQHYIRYTRNLKVLAWLGNDAMAKDQLELAAELFRLSFNEYNQSSSGVPQAGGLRHTMNYVEEFPGNGVQFGRGQAWGLDTMLCAYSLGDEEFREKTYGWMEIMAQLIADGQSTCTGTIQAKRMNGLLNGQYRVRQSYETSITENALWGLKETVFRDRDEARRDQIEDCITASMYANVSPLIWRDEHNGPVSYIGLGPYDNTQPLFCENIPNGAEGSGADHHYIWTPFAYAYELTGDDVFLSRAIQMHGGGSLSNALHSDGMNNIHNKAALLAMMQQVQAAN